MVAPENICGLPVRGDNFFDRTDVLRRAWERLETDHLLLAAPRRVGKTSLMHKLVHDARARGWRAGVYTSAQNVEDERAFVAKIYAAVAKAPECEAVRDHLTSGRFKDALKGVSTLSVGPLAVALRDAAATLTTIRAALSGFYTDLDREERRRGLLEVLEGDGYIVYVDERWRFRSPLLRRVWAARSER